MTRGARSDVYTETLAVFESVDGPLTTTEVAEPLELPRRTAYKRLSTLVDRGALRTKKVGANARVWWRADAAAGAPAVDDPVFRAVFDGAFDAMVLADDTGAWVEVNPAACELFGAPREELLGKTPASFAPEGYDVEAAWAEFLASDLDRGLYPLVRVDGEERVAEFAATPNVVQGLHLSVLRDVTERERSTAELARLHHLNTTIRGIDRATNRAETPRALAADICDSLLESEVYQYATLCTVAPAGDVHDTLALAGRDAITAAVAAADLPAVGLDAAGRAVETERVQVERVPENGDELPTSGWLATLADHGLRSTATVPLVHDGVVRGVLGVASTRREAFDAEERVVLRELGRTVGYGFDTLDRRRSLLDGEVLVVTLRSREMVAPLAAIADVEGTTITLDQTIPLADGVVSYATITGLDPEPVLAFLDAADLGVDARLLGHVGDTSWFEFRGYESPPATLLAEFGGRVVRAAVEGGEIEFVVEVPTGTDVRALAETFERLASDVTVAAQDHRHRADTSHRDVLTAFGQTLTERQRTALELAVYAGYFEWPRQSTGEELATLLDVHPSTFHYHLRVAQRKLLGALFDGEGDAEDST